MIPNLSGNLSSVLNLVPLPGKLTIIPLKDAVPVPFPAGPPFVAMFNPENMSEGSNPQYNDAQAFGTEGAQQRYNHTPPGHFNFEFLIDGTGASGDKREVIAEVELLKQTVKLRGDQHRPSFLLFVYGAFIKTGVMVNMSIQYTMFRSNGTPLRAKINLSCREHTPQVLNLLESNFLSPDLTRRHTVKEGESLPRLCNAFYDSPRLYIEVARANGKTNIRKLEAGEEIVFPPIEK